MYLRNPLALISAALVFVLAGCASAPEQGSPAMLAAYRATLSNPEALQPAPNQPGAYRWLAPNANLGRYDKVLFDRIAVRLDDKAEYKSVDPVALAQLVEYFRQALVKALTPQYPVVDQAGPGVLRVRITIVDVVPNDVAVSMGVTAIAGPVATMLISEATGEPKGAAPYLGRTGITVAVIDSQTNRVIGEYADTRFGQQYVLDLNKGVTGMVEANATSFYSSMSKWSYVDQAFDGWAKLFRQRLDQAHGR